MDEDPFIHFHIELYDSLHFWLFHLYDVGLRSTKKDIESDAAPIRISEDGGQEAICYDAVWSRMVQRIRKRKEETKYLQRYSRVKKYDLKATITSEVRQIAKKRESERLTFRDSLMVFARKHCPSTSAAASLQRLHSFVMKEKYDSNAIVDDVGDHGDESNLADVLNDNIFATGNCPLKCPGKLVLFNTFKPTIDSRDVTIIFVVCSNTLIFGPFSKFPVTVWTDPQPEISSKKMVIHNGCCVS